MPPRPCGFSLLSLASDAVSNSVSALSVLLPCSYLSDIPEPVGIPPRFPFKTWPSADLGCWMKPRSCNMEIPEQSFSSLMAAELSDSGRRCPVYTQPVLCVCTVCSVCLVCSLCLTGGRHVPVVYVSSQWLAGQSCYSVYKGGP